MAKRIPAGEMRHTVKIERHTIETTADTTGDPYNYYAHISSTSGDWSDVLSCRAKIENLRGEEGILARQVYPSASHRITINYFSTMNTTGATRRRVTFGSRTMHIGAILNPDEENLQLQLLVGEEK